MRPYRLLQISDTHLLPAGAPGADAALLRLEAVLAWAEAGPAPAALLLTGDIADVPDAGVYASLAARLARLPAPVLPLPGNHDDPALLAAHLPSSPLESPVVWHLGHWAICLLNSHLEGACGGRLGPERRAALAATLAVTEAEHWLIAVHHPPVPIGSPWMDAMGLADGAALLDQLALDGRVRAVVWGHVHQHFASHHRGMRLLACPATRVQFMPHSAVCQAEDSRPALRWLELDPYGGVVSGVVRLPVPA